MNLFNKEDCEQVLYEVYVKGRRTVVFGKLNYTVDENNLCGIVIFHMKQAVDIIYVDLTMAHHRDKGA